MNLRDLDYLVALAETGHFGEAAARCNVTQPTLSTQIRKLEQTLGATLFERGQRRVVPTATGRLVIAQARLVRDEVARLREIARAGTDPLAGPFQLGVIPTAGPYVLPRLLPALTGGHPDLRLHLREDVTQRLVERLRGAELDAAILSLPVDEPDLELAPLLEEPFVLALPEAHPLAAASALSENDLRGARVLMLEEGHCLRDQVTPLCRRLSLVPDSGPVATSIESLRLMVAAGMGLAILPACAAEGPFATTLPLAFRDLPPPRPTRTLVLAWRRSFPRGHGLRALAARLRSALAGRDDPRVVLDAAATLPHQ
jgi:LysR family transcriptional regulator, hydrogen peroxide-inducible genes activator